MRLSLQPDSYAISLSPMQELYVYYRVASAATTQAEDEVRALQAELCKRMPGLTARWLRRTEAATPSAPQTWMEVYAHPAGLSDNDISAILSRGQAVVRSIDGPRHPEVFSPCA